MSSTRAALGLLATMVTMVAACTTETAGQPTPSAQTTATTETGTPTSTPLARARTFELATVDPCVLLSPTQLVQLGIDQPVTPSGDAETDPTCNFISTTGASYGVFLELTANASDTVEAAASKVTETVAIDGFDVPLISVPNQGCSAFVNTGDSQYVSVQANGTGVIPDDELCQLVQPATQMVLANLTALQP